MKRTKRPVRNLRVFFMATSFAVAGCQSRPAADRPIDLGAAFNQPSATLLPAGDYHLVTLRNRDATDGQILCSEPSPDWAVAFGKSLSGSLSASAPNGTSGAASLSNASTEAVTAMLGRTAGVVALRDGLYSACQAYANKVIGKDDYALILSQFGNLLVALAAGGSTGAAASGGAAAPAAPAGVAVAVTAGASLAPAGGAAPSSSGGGSAQVAQMQQQAVQALLVSCISEYDPTLHKQYPSTPQDPGDKNALLVQFCPAVFQQVVAHLPALLAPPASGAQAEGPAKPKPDPQVLALQLKLRKAGERIPVDGIFGAATARALQHLLATDPDALKG